MSNDRPAPLARLMAMGFRLLIDDLHAALAERGWVDVRESYGFVLLALRSGDASVSELAALLGVSKQATSKLLDAMEDGGYVLRRDDEQDRRAKVVSIDRRGEELLAAVESIYAELESGWAAVIGKAELAGLRDGLESVLRARFGSDLPQLRPT